MISVLVDLAITFLVAAVALSVGWIARAVATRTTAATNEDDGPAEASRAREVLARLHELAARVAADVGQHNHRVAAINEELKSAEGAEPEIVVTAIAKLVQANGEMQQQLASAEGKLEQQARQIKSYVTAARTDALTGLANRRAFDEEIARRYAEFERHGRSFSVLMVDVDHFKKFNDAHGHQAGDAVLRGVAKVLQDNSREMDLVARYGGEEFAVVYPGALVADTKAQVNRLRRAIENTPFTFEGKDLHVTASMGIANLLIDEDAARLIQRSDAALYASKAAGRNCVHWHDGQAVHPIADEGPLPAGKPPAAKPSGPPAPAPAPPVAKHPPRAKVASDAPRPKPAAAGLHAGPTSELQNRTDFCRAVGRHLSQWQRTGQPLTVLLVQIDCLQEIVARHGPQVAQLALRATSQLLARVIRDTDDTGQYGDDTVALLMPDAPGASAVEVAERLRHSIARFKLPLDGTAETVTVSVGGAEATTGDNLPRLLGRAEAALELARTTGGNRCFFHNGRSAEPAGAVHGAAMG